MSSLLPAIEIQTGVSPTYSVIWMHGLGADGSDFESIIPELALPETSAVRFIFPHAPEIAVTCNGGFVMRAWYDIISLDRTNRIIDETGIRESCTAIRRLIERENQRGISCDRIFLAGFSQGGAVAYTTALTHPAPLAGVIALSTYLPVHQLIEDEGTATNRSIPIFAAHGTEDDVVSLELGVLARDFLVSQGYSVGWSAYPMPHSICIEEVEAIGRWLTTRMAEPIS